MTSLLPHLHEGHAPIYLHQAFHEAIDAYEDWNSGDSEPVITINGKAARISVVFRRLWSCTDIVPRHTLEALRDIVPAHLLDADHWKNIATFGQAAHIMRNAMQKRIERRLPVIMY